MSWSRCSGWQVAHPADRPVDSLAAVGRQLPELLKKLARLLLLILSQVLPGFHAVEHALLLLRWQVGKMLQPVLQSHLLLRRKPSELRIVFERAALLRGRQILIAAKPVSGVAGLVLRTMRFIGAAGVRAALFLKPVPLPIRTLGLLTRWLRRLRRQMQFGRTTASAAEAPPDSPQFAPGPTCLGPLVSLS